MSDLLVKAGCSPDCPPISLISKIFLERGITCNQGAMWSSWAGVVQNKVAYHRHCLDVVYFVSTYHRTTGHVVKRRGWVYRPYVRSSDRCSDFCSDICSDFVPNVSVVFPQKNCRKESAIRTKIREGLSHSEYGPQSTGWLTRECRFWCGWDIHINYYPHKSRSGSLPYDNASS